MITRIIMAAVIEYDSFVIALYPLCSLQALPSSVSETDVKSQGQTSIDIKGQ